MNLLPTRMGAAIAAVALVTSAVPAQASAFPCFDTNDMQSARIHDLRVMLMVNALKCRQLSPATLRQYGRFLEERSDEMSVHGDKIEQSLVARYGPEQGRVAFNDYETRIGNYHAGTQPTRELCDDVSTFMKLASRANHAELETLSKLATNRAISTCLVPQETGYTAPIAEAVIEESPAANADLTEAPQIVDGIPTFANAADAPASSPEPMETVALVEPEGPAPEAAPTSEDRLAQAISALDAAAAALRGMQEEDKAASE